MNASESARPAPTATRDTHATRIAPGTTRHLASLDILRACAALMVFTYHCHTEFGLAVHTPYSPTIAQGRFGVHLFYALSGYLIYATLDRDWNTPSPTHSRRYWLWNFWTKRFFRIYPLYVANIAVVLALSTTIRNGLTTGNLLAHLFGLHSLFRPHHGAINGVLWTLSIEIQFYALAPFLYLWARRVSDRMLIICTLTLWVASYLTIRYGLIDTLGFWTKDGAPDAWSYFIGLSQLPSALPLFVIGFLAYRRKTAAASYATIILAVALFAALPYAQRQFARAQVDRVLLTSVSGLLAGCCFLPLLANASAITIKENLLTRFLWWISDISYSFYIWHMLVIHLVLQHFPAQSLGFKVIVSFWLTAIFADFTRRFIERPGIDVGARLLGTRQPSVVTVAG